MKIASEKAKTPLEILQLFKDKKLPENFCIIPFVNMIFNPNGEIGICRQKGTQHFVGDLKTENIENIWNNEYMQNWREEFLTGNICICKKEVEEDFCNLGATNYEYFDEVKLDKIQDLPMKKFTANFNGKCNLECIMCDVWKMPNGFYDKNDFWSNAETRFFPYIKEMELLSGEPFVQKDTWKLIDVVSEVNSDCQWSFTTNAHWNLNKFIKTKLNKIQIKNIHLSVDSLDGENYALIRKKGNLDIVKNNINSLIKYEKERVLENKSKLGMALHFLIMKENWTELADVIDYVDIKGIKLILDVLKIPQENSILNLSEKERLIIINSYFDKLSLDHLKRSIRVVTPLIKSLSKKNQKIYFVKLKGRTNVD
jgi:cyclic pyranopterin phosphate synthase